MEIRYGLYEEGWRERTELVRALAANSNRVCEVGAGANPALPPRSDYVLLDMASEELAKAEAGYEKLIADISSSAFSAPQQFNLVFSFCTLEHIRSPALFHRNVWDLLVPGGLAVHFFPTLYAFPFLVNRVLPHRLSQFILLHHVDAERRSEGNHAKFPAFYRGCRGPTARQIDAFSEQGWLVNEYRGYFGHSYYRKIPALQRITDISSRWVLRHPVPAFTTFALVVLQKPQDAA